MMIAALIDRDSLIEYSWDYFMFVMMKPETMHELMIALISSIVVLTIILAKMHMFGNSQSGSLVIGFVVGIVGIFGMIETAALIQLYFLPLIETEKYHKFWFIFLLASSFFLMVVPFTRALFRSHYWTSVGAWAVSIVFVCIVLVAVDTITKNEKGPPPTIDEVKDYTDDIKNSIKKT